MRSRSSLCVLALLLIAGSASPAYSQSTDQNVEAAQEAAQEWMALVDADEYEASWSEAAEFFKAQLTAEQWAQQVQQARGALDALQDRSLIAARHTTSLPNAPEGEYVIAQYRATYGSEPLIETVTLMQEESAWRVIGYYIQPEGQ